MITKTLAKLLIQEHKYQPISGNIEDNREQIKE
jgi:hypothetical protein